MRKPLTIALLSAMLATISSNSIAEFKVTEAPVTCRNAHALLVATKSREVKYIWRQIGIAAASDPDKFEVVDEYEPGVVRRVSFRRYQVRDRDGMTGYVAHCGHGGTCNDLTNAFFKLHPDWGSPIVFCGPIPDALHSPSKPDLNNM